MSNPELDPDCHMRKEEIAFHENRARGGMASVAIGLGIVDPDRADAYEGSEALRRDVPSVAEGGCTNADPPAQLPRGYGACRMAANTPVRAAMAIRIRSQPSTARTTRSTQKGLAVTQHDGGGHLPQLRVCFGRGGQRSAKKAGFDMVLIHGGHGWLLGAVHAPRLMNRRTDRWGGSLENRMRSSRCSSSKRCARPSARGFPIEFRMSGAELVKGGYGTRRGRGDGKDAIDGKVDIIHVSAGVHEDPAAFVRDASVHVHRARLQRLSGRGDQKARENAGRHAGRPERSGDDGGDRRLQARRTSWRLARQSICDPYFPEKAFSGHADDITRCCRCFTCFYNYLTNRTFCCAFNPVVGQRAGAQTCLCRPQRRRRRSWSWAAAPAAWRRPSSAAQRRGHAVTLYEKERAARRAAVSRSSTFRSSRICTTLSKCWKGRLARRRAWTCA